MKTDGLAKHLTLVFVMALSLYVAVYSCDRHLRVRKGAWQVTFQQSTNGEPSITVQEPVLGITNVTILFVGESLPTNVPPTSVVIDIPRKPLPFGEIIFDDLMYLPGTVTFNFFGHIVELIPRALFINGREHAWRPNALYPLSPADKPARAPATARP
jgi:hypothetical protein